MESKTYRQLTVWQKAMDLVQMIYIATKKFPTEERFGLTSQLRRAAVSIPSNIAEGQGRKSESEFSHFISIAYGSLRETETQLFIAVRLGYLEQSEANAVLSLAGEVGRLLNGLAKSLRRPHAARCLLSD
jgi:four helix bundle protein